MAARGRYNNNCCSRIILEPVAKNQGNMIQDTVNE